MFYLFHKRIALLADLLDLINLCVSFVSPLLNILIVLLVTGESIEKKGILGRCFECLAGGIFVFNSQEKRREILAIRRSPVTNKTMSKIDL